MNIESLPLDENERRYFRERKVSNEDLLAIQKLTEESYACLWRGIVPQGLTDATMFPVDHWSANAQVSGPHLPRPSINDNIEWKTVEAKWRAELEKFFIRAFEFGPEENVLIADYGGAYITKWRIFILNPDPFCPWHDRAIVMKRDSNQTGILSEDYTWVARARRPAIIGFDSKGFRKQQAE